MVRRVLGKSRIKDGCLEEYIKIHNEIKDQVLEEYRAQGIITISCFVDGLDLYVYKEYDDAFENVEPGPFSKELQELLYPVKDWSRGSIPLHEVYRMERCEK